MKASDINYVLPHFRLFRNADRFTPEEKIKMKQDILTEVYKTNDLQQVIRAMSWTEFKISNNTQIAEDVIQHVFMQLSRYNTDKLIEMYLDQGKCRIVGLGIMIARREGFALDKKVLSSSIARRILFASNYHSLNEDNIVFKDEQESEYVEYDSTTDEVWITIKSELTKEENEFLEYWLTHKKTVGRYKKDVMEQYQQLLNRIRKICTKNKFKL